MQGPEKMKLGQAGREPATRADEAETGATCCRPRRVGGVLPPLGAGPVLPLGPQKEPWLWTSGLQAPRERTSVV